MVEAVEALCKILSQTEPENGPAKECQDFVVCVSELDNWQCEIAELQMSIRSSFPFLQIGNLVECAVVSCSCE